VKGKGGKGREKEGGEGNGGCLLLNSSLATPLVTGLTTGEFCSGGPSGLCPLNGPSMAAEANEHSSQSDCQKMLFTTQERSLDLLECKKTFTQPKLHALWTQLGRIQIQLIGRCLVTCSCAHLQIQITSYIVIRNLLRLRMVNKYNNNNTHLTDTLLYGTTRVSRYQYVKPSWILLQQGKMEVAVVSTATLRRTMFQSNHHRQHTNCTQFLQTGCPSCRSTNSIKR